MPKDRDQSLLELFIQINREVAAALDLRTVLQRLLFAALQNVGGERGSIVVLDDNGKPVDATIVYGKSFHEHTTQQLRETVDRGLAGWVVKNRQAALVRDTSKDERWLHRPDDASDKSGSKSAICVPLLARDRLIGVLTLVHPVPNAFSDEHLELMQAIANQASIAVLNAQLFGQSQKAQQRYRELFEESIDPIFITDWDGKIIEANREAVRLSGFSNDDLHRMSIDQLHEVNWNKTGMEFENLSGADEANYESVLHRADSGKTPIEVYARRVEFEDVQSVQWTLRDITERKELDSLREDLMAMIYHDLRSPLGNIVSSLDVLRGMIGDDEAAQSILNIAVNSTDRIQRLVNSLLDISRLESGQTIVTQTAVHPQDLIDEAIRDVMPSASGRRQTVEAQIGDQLPDIWVDADMMRRVFINLLENAIKFSKVETKIVIGAQKERGSMRFWVQDSGPGIPPSEQKRIFEKFARVKGKDKPGGLGIGLAFCRIAVQAHGGTIWVESEEGKGSKFIFTLPVMNK
jgi:PAS domain S-box-containing protein